MTVMFNRRRLLTGCAAASLVPANLATIFQTPAAFASEPRAPFRRGASVHNVMNWASLDPADKLKYQWPPFATPQHQLPTAILDNMRHAGFDFIRLTLDPGVFLQIEGSRRNELDTMLRDNVRRLIAMGFGVIVDFHPNSQVPTYSPEKITRSADSSLFRAYGEMLVSTARVLSAFKGERIALELMNEPQWGWDASSTARWQAMQKVWHDQVRSVASDLTLILTGARGGDKDGLLAMDASPYRGSDVLWSFHYYAPYILTHQGVKSEEKNSRLWQYFSDLPYPAAPEHFDDAYRLIRRNIEADKAVTLENRASLLAEARKTLMDYLETRPGRAMVAADFKQVADWAKRNGVPQHRIFLGEFGITRSYGRYRASPPEPLENWLSDVRTEAEANGLGWALWLVTGYGGMSLIETDDSVALDRPTVAALGLTKR